MEMQFRRAVIHQHNPPVRLFANEMFNIDFNSVRWPVI